MGWAVEHFEGDSQDLTGIFLQDSVDQVDVEAEERRKMISGSLLSFFLSFFLSLSLSVSGAELAGGKLMVRARARTAQAEAAAKDGASELSE